MDWVVGMMALSRSAPPAGCPSKRGRVSGFAHDYQRPCSLPRRKIFFTRLATVCVVPGGYESGACAGNSTTQWCLSPQFSHQASKLATRCFSWAKTPQAAQTVAWSQNGQFGLASGFANIPSLTGSHFLSFSIAAFQCACFSSSGSGMITTIQLAYHASKYRPLIHRRFVLRFFSGLLVPKLLPWQTDHH